MTDAAAPTTTLLAIHLRPGARVPVRKVDRATAVAGKGLEGDHAGGGNRQVTLLSAQAWREACAVLGRDLDPGIRRANLVIDDPDLAKTIGARLRFGEVLIEVVGETRPCELMDDDGRLGLQAALRPARRGGVYGRILSGGELTVGMPCVREP
jgi:MOSC domain-containing protein YiiM